jgi:hypothetical protein
MTNEAYKGVCSCCVDCNVLTREELDLLGSDG